MKNNGRVRGGKEASASIIFNHDNVYIHTNVIKVEHDNEDGMPDFDEYEYNEIILSKDEYLTYLQSRVNDLEEVIAELIGN